MGENLRPSLPEHIGRYRIVERIGKGAMGVVYAAHDELMERDVAVKVLMTDLEGEPEIRARFMREAQVSARLSHRNIVTVYDIGEDNGRLFIVMELLRGQTLDKCLKQRTLSIEEKVDITLQVCEGLTVANAAGVCHRDVKPGNLFLQGDGGVKILDFGIARLASSSMTTSGFIVGTPDYMSPEQARGVTIDERSDIFSVGAVLYLMLSGRKPFAAPDLPAVLHKVLSEDPPPLGPEAAPASLAHIVLKALAKDPNERFQSFSELSAELSRWRRSYEVGTRARANEAAATIDRLHTLAAQERQSAEALGVPPESDLSAALSTIADGFPDVLARSGEALRAGPWQRADVDAIAQRAGPIVAAAEERVAALRAAGHELVAARGLLEEGDARGALAGFDAVLRRIPAAAIQPLINRAQQVAAEQQARDDRVRSLLAEATNAHNIGGLEAARALVEQALEVHPSSHEASQLLALVQHDQAAAEVRKIRRCEQCLERARRALQLDQLEEAERQLGFAADTGAVNPGIAIVRAALIEARTAREIADAQTQEIAGELARARAEFQEGNRGAALTRLQALASRHPLSAAASAELARLQAEDQRLDAIERTCGEAEQLASAAAAALARGDADAAIALAEKALTLVPSHELSLRTSAMAHAHLREVAERAAREERARRFVDRARGYLASGRFERAVKEARRASELDPNGTAAPALIAEAFRLQADEARAEALAEEAARRAAEVRDILRTALGALRSKDFTRARELAERALAIDPDRSEPGEMIAKIAAAAALAAKTLEDETVDLQKPELDPDATAVFAPVSEGTGRRWSSGVPAWCRRIWTSGAAAIRYRFATRAGKAVSAQASGGATKSRET